MLSQILYDLYVVSLPVDALVGKADRRNARGPRSIERLGPLDIADDHADLRADARLRVEERLQIRPRAGCEHPDAQGRHPCTTTSGSARPGAGSITPISNAGCPRA